LTFSFAFYFHGHQQRYCIKKQRSLELCTGDVLAHTNIPQNVSILAVIGMVNIDTHGSSVNKGGERSEKIPADSSLAYLAILYELSVRQAIGHSQRGWGG
jgi:hypothetical protein